MLISRERGIRDSTILRRSIRSIRLGSHLTAHTFFQNHESLYLHHRDGRMPREMYEPQLSNMTAFLGYPGLQAVWDLRKHYFHSAFRSLVDDTIATARTGPMPNLYRERPAQSG